MLPTQHTEKSKYHEGRAGRVIANTCCWKLGTQSALKLGITQTRLASTLILYERPCRPVAAEINTEQKQLRMTFRNIIQLKRLNWKKIFFIWNFDFLFVFRFLTALPSKYHQVKFSLFWTSRFLDAGIGLKWIWRCPIKQKKNSPIVVELTCTRQMHMALPDLSGNPKQGTPCLGPRVQNCHL